MSGGVGFPLEIDRWLVVGRRRGGGFREVDTCDGGECNSELIGVSLCIFEVDGGGERGLCWTEEGCEEGVGVRQEFIPGNHGVIRRA